MAQDREFGELDGGDFVELERREILANRKLLKFAKAYRLKDVEIEDIKDNLQKWENEYYEELVKNLKRTNVINTFNTSVGTVFEVQLVDNLNVEDLVFYNKSYYQIDRVLMPKIPGNMTKVSLVVHEVKLNESEAA